jgi:hypothetical protein
MLRVDRASHEQLNTLGGGLLLGSSRIARYHAARGG